jgi:hypothetical protein
MIGLRRIQGKEIESVKVHIIYAFEYAMVYSSAPTQMSMDYPSCACLSHVYHLSHHIITQQFGYFRLDLEAHSSTSHHTFVSSLSIPSHFHHLHHLPIPNLVSTSSQTRSGTYSKPSIIRRCTWPRSTAGFGVMATLAAPGLGSRRIEC